MYRYGTFVTILLLGLLFAIVSCSGSGPLSQEIAADNPQLEDQPVPAGMFDGMPEFPVEDESAPQIDKGLSWLYNADPQTPILEHRTNICPLHPNCLQYHGWYGTPATFVPPPPHFANGMYQIPLGASAPDLEKMRLEGAMSAAGEHYYLAIANWTAMAWQWYGPAGSTPEYVMDFTTLGYDYSSPGGNMYFVVVVPQHNTLDLWKIELEFKDPTGIPMFWNVWGQAYDNYIPGAAPTVLPGETVTFEDQLTGTVYSTITGPNGAWGTNLPDGFFKFKVTNSQMLFDLPGFMPVEDLPVILEVNAGNIVYHGPNAVYDGSIMPMPIVTLNTF